MNQTNNSISFMARMHLSQLVNLDKVKIDKNRWANIARITEKKTAKNPDHEFNLYSSPWRQDIKVQVQNFTEPNTLEITMQPEDFKKLMKLSDERVAVKFGKMLNMLIHAQKLGTSMENFSAKLKKNFKHADPARITNPMYDAWDNALRTELKAMQEKDRFLKNLDIMYQ